MSDDEIQRKIAELTREIAEGERRLKIIRWRMRILRLGIAQAATLLLALACAYFSGNIALIWLTLAANVHFFFFAAPMVDNEIARSKREDS